MTRPDRYAPSTAARADLPLNGAAMRLTVLIGEDDVWHHHPLFTEIVHRAHAHGLAGATVLRGVEGYAGSRRIHTSRLLSLAENLPVAVILIDTEERIRSFVADQLDIVSGGLITLEQVEVVSPGGPTDASRSAGKR